MKSRTPHAPRKRKRPNELLTASRTTESTAVQPESNASAPYIGPERRSAMIAEAAYYRAEQRGFEPGHELEDWCAAESDTDKLLARDEASSVCGRSP